MTQLCLTGVSPSVFIIRFCCVPVDFEVVNVDSSMMSEDDINNAIMAIRRNGVALKGQFVSECICEICSYKGLENLDNLVMSDSFAL